MKKTTALSILAILSVSLGGCGGNNDFKATASMPVNDLFAQACAGCHGENGEGKFGILLKLAGSDDAAEEMAEKIRHGGHIMPAFPNISEAEAISIATFLKSR
ncbi:MAG: c-type cytochrome [Candidatus Thiodiazotropha sp. (ex Monitilora ramsayi)]|nr:c-type cytochrome [Candidatus Thiodiazotropha sp. (ex Monitilora ramsayi)]